MWGFLPHEGFSPRIFHRASTIWESESRECVLSVRKSLPRVRGKRGATTCGWLWNLPQSDHCLSASTVSARQVCSSSAAVRPACPIGDAAGINIDLLYICSLQSYLRAADGLGLILFRWILWAVARMESGQAFVLGTVCLTYLRSVHLYLNSSGCQLLLNRATVCLKIIILS